MIKIKNINSNDTAVKEFAHYIVTALYCTSPNHDRNQYPKPYPNPNTNLHSNLKFWRNIVVESSPVIIPCSREPLTTANVSTADVTTANVTTANVTIADGLVLG